MKVWNKIMVLLLAFSMTIAVTSCGKSGDGEMGNTGGSSSEFGFDGENVPYERLENGTVNFGSYPQTRVMDEELTALLLETVDETPSEGSEKWISYGYYADGENETEYMWYCDVIHEDVKYRAVYFEEYRPNHTFAPSSVNCQQENGYEVELVYWFQWEALNWIVLEEGDGSAFLHCNSIIDAQEYYSHRDNRVINGEKIYANNYKQSNIRKWLNEIFYETAFTAAEQRYIQSTLLDNSEKSTNPNGNPLYWNNGVNEYACEDTEDKVFLLSYEEITNPAYGFEGAAKDRNSSDYAKSQGCYFYRLTGTVKYVSPWWLRSPFYGHDDAVQNLDYYNENNYYYVHYTECGVCPALWLRL
ncbi:MAG: hypothetical protein IJV83_04940 [Clostridia bacterium]|nr:hypothetical protein [Clostridia bacterium]